MRLRSYFDLVVFLSVTVGWFLSPPFAIVEPKRSKLILFEVIPISQNETSLVTFVSN